MVDILRNIKHVDAMVSRGCFLAQVPYSNRRRQFSFALSTLIFFDGVCFSFLLCPLENAMDI